MTANRVAVRFNQFDAPNDNRDVRRGNQIGSLANEPCATWNESGFANAEIDALLQQRLSIADAGKRRRIMVKKRKIMQDLGVVIQF